MRKWLKDLAVGFLTAEARLALFVHRPKIVAVTGNLGKTTAKDAIFAAISPQISARKSPKSYNSDIGVPLAILALENPWSDPWRWMLAFVRGFFSALTPRYPKVLVLEVGADKPGDIRSIARWLRPDIAIFTGVPQIPVHIEFFDSREHLLAEKRSLLEYVKPGGTLIVNGDDPSSEDALRGLTEKVVRYGFDPSCDFAAIDERTRFDRKRMPVGVEARIVHANTSYPLVISDAIGKPRVYAALVALSVAGQLGLDLRDAVHALSAWKPPHGRMHIVRGVHGALILDDSYNASPAATISALDTLDSLKPSGKRIAVLADMRELGTYTEEAHRQVGVRAASACDLLITVGEAARDIAKAAHEAGFPFTSIRSYNGDESTRAGRDLAGELKSGDVVLVKGSQSLRMERAVAALMANPAEAASLLVRSDADWRKKA